MLGLGAVGAGPAVRGRAWVALGNSPVRMEMARRMGAHEAFLSSDPDLAGKLDRFTDGVGIDLVILTANPWPAYRTAVEVVRNGGRVSIVSLLGRGEEKLDFNPLVLDWFYDKGISLIAVNGSAGYRFPGEPDTPARFSWNNSCAHVPLSLMADGRLSPKRLITHRMPYQDMKQGLRDGLPPREGDAGRRVRLARRLSVRLHRAVDRPARSTETVKGSRGKAALRCRHQRHRNHAPGHHGHHAGGAGVGQPEPAGAP